MSITFGEFQAFAFGYQIQAMQTASETRKLRLDRLIAEFGSVAALNEALGWSRTDPKLMQIRNGNIRTGRDKPYQMGDAMAREIESKLNLPLGQMDTPLSYAEINGQEDPRAKAMQLMEAMPPEMWPTAVRLLDALTKPVGNGTHG